MGFSFFGVLGHIVLQELAVPADGEVGQFKNVASIGCVKKLFFVGGRIDELEGQVCAVARRQNMWSQAQDKTSARSHTRRLAVRRE